jgi:pimeloyl-ACP methyl ester carboxylesterase
MSPSPPIILLPGIGLDDRLYATQRAEFPQIVVPDWLPPRFRESLPDYARRMAEAVDPAGPCYVGGLSFGGMVALEMSRHLDCRGCFLISSILSRDELPKWAKFLAPWAWMLPPRCDLLGAVAGTAILWTAGGLLPKRWKQFCTHLSKTRSPMLPWACRAVVRWTPSEPFRCPIYRIHGENDPILPYRGAGADHLVPRGGHLLPLSHPFVVSEFLRRGLEAMRIEEQAAPADATDVSWNDCIESGASARDAP